MHNFLNLNLTQISGIQDSVCVIDGTDQNSLPSVIEAESGSSAELPCEFLYKLVSYPPFPVGKALNRHLQCPTWILWLYNV